ncbi:MAG: 4-hydroxy-tetrahydrodipicolinate synthase [Alphaproteobacteria bacterium]|jgi:4-hydroxy-tetrahydrodipicolinate synthase|nr:4-hydroxy-tetrahydrodipicolinate synthase [Alphaproteobacteria bacterium]
MSDTTFHGSSVALVTPFQDGAVDYEALERLIEWHIDQGTHGLVPVGTTGESPTLTHEEHEQVVAVTVAKANGRIPVMAGAGSNATAEAIGFARHAENVGADAALVVTPYYNKPSQEGLYAHFAAVAAATSLPIFIYNIPGRSIVDMSVDTMARLAEIPNIVGVKDATAKLERISQQRLACGKDFIQLSGEDATTLGAMAMGAHGVISVTANVAPALCAAYQEACLKGDFAKALEIQDKLMPLHDALFAYPSPAPAKYALAKMGMIREELRLPLVKVPEHVARQVDAALDHAGISA